MKILQIIVIAFVCLLSLEASAKPESSSKIIYIKNPFDSSINKLPSRFYGHDLKRIHQKITELKKAANKGEFETNEEYKRRMEWNASNPNILYDKVLAESLLAFRSEQAVSSEYDVDGAIAKIQVSLNKFRGYSNENLLDIPIIYQRKDTTYITQNSFGGHVTVDKTTGQDWGLLVSRTQFITAEYGGYSFSVPMEINTAKRLKQKIKDDSVACLVVGYLASSPPYVIEAKLWKQATFDNTNAYDVALHMVGFSVTELWIFDVKNGEIFAKFQVSNTN